MASDDSLPRFSRSASYPVIKRFGRFGSLGSPSSFPSSPKSGENEAFLEKTARFLSSRAFLLTAACLYMLGCIALPHAPGFTSSSQDQTGALNDEMSYVFQIDGKYNRFQAAGSYLLRRMNIESEKSSGNKYYHKQSVNNNPLVTYRKHGNVVPLLNALNSSFWSENAIGNTSAASGYKFKLDEDLEPINEDIPDGCPQGPVRIFIGITSRSGTDSAVKKRAAIRDSWFQTVKEFSTSMQAYFMLSQQEDFSLQYTAELIAEEAFKYGDIVILPGLEKYVELPSKSFALLQYALSSPCKFTHIVKTDDDVFLRPQKLLDIVLNGELDYAMPFYYGGSVNTSAAKDGGHHLLMEWENNRIEKSMGAMSLVRAANYSVEDAEWSSLISFDGQSKNVSKPWMEKMYIGKVDSNKTSCYPGCEGVFPGWEPNRTSSSKWFLSHSVLSDDDAVDAFSVRWLSGWGYMLSRDLVELVLEDVKRFSSAEAIDRPSWWGKLPWEDTVVASLLSRHEGVELSYHKGFKAAWDICSPDTVLKHLDNDAPLLTEGLQAQEASGLWSINSVTCSTGPYEAGNYNEWRRWRNNLPDTMAGGFM